MIYGLIALLILAAAAGAVGWMRSRRSDDIRYHTALDRSIVVDSDAFADGESESVSPPLAWSNLPPGTKSLALTVTDEDLPFPELALFHVVHWILYDIPASTDGLAAGVAGEQLDEAGILRGRTLFGRRRYLPPCPLSGRHRYAFRLYAMDADKLGHAALDRTQLLRMMRGHILAYGELNGYCRR
jgi:Raf kinase inhibitor-like YbhB/YbcL family protein